MEVRTMTEQDIEATVQLHLRAFKGYMNASLGKKYVHSFLDWFRTSTIGVAFVAADGSNVLGYVVGAPLGYDSALNKALLKNGIWAIITHPGILFHAHFIGTIKSRLKLLFKEKKIPLKVNKEPSGHGISLVGIAVDPENFKKGVGSLLMKSFGEYAKSYGYDYMRLSVYEVNEKARKLYTKSGWKILEIDGPVVYYYKEN